MKDAVIVSAVRTPVGKAPKGTLSIVRPDDMAAAVIKAALERAPGVSPADVDDVILGCAMPEGEQGLNVARLSAIRLYQSRSESDVPTGPIQVRVAPGAAEGAWAERVADVT